jgi:hypothetical protein
LACTPECGDSEVEKNHSRANREAAGDSADSGPALPKTQSEEGREQKEECAGGLKPDDSANAAEGAEKAADTFSYGAPGFRCDARSGLRLRASWGDEGRSSGEGLHIGDGLIRTGGRGARNATACDASGDADADTKGAANVSRFHTVYDGSSGSRYISRFGAGQGLLSFPDCRVALDADWK